MGAKTRAWLLPRTGGQRGVKGGMLRGESGRWKEGPTSAFHSADGNGERMDLAEKSARKPSPRSGEGGLAKQGRMGCGEQGSTRVWLAQPVCKAFGGHKPADHAPSDLTSSGHLPRFAEKAFLS